jgi:hypothetical protein
LTHEGNKVELRVKNLSNNTNYDDFGKIEKRQDPEATKHKCYIVPYPDTTYSIEVILKKGSGLKKGKMVYAKLLILKLATRTLLLSSRK